MGEAKPAEDKQQPVDTMSTAQLTQLFQQVGAWIKNTNSAMALLREEVASVRKGGAPEPQPQPKQEPLDEKRLEELSRAELVDLIVNKVREDVVKPVVKTVQADKEASLRDKLTAQVRETAGKHPDFMDWADEMKRVSASHPTLNVEEVYHLAKLQNPEKAKEVDSKIAEVLKKEEEEKKEKAEKSNVVPVSFGGLLPTSGMTSKKPEGAMSSKDAAEAAWDATQMGEHLAAVSE